MKPGTAEMDAVQGALLKFLAETTHDPRLSREIRGDDNLFELGILDSMGVVQLVMFIEEHFGIRMSEDDLASSEFTHLRGLAEIIVRHQMEYTEGRPRPSAVSGGSD